MSEPAREDEGLPPGEVPWFDTNSDLTVVKPSQDEKPKDASPSTTKRREWQFLSRIQEFHDRDRASGLHKKELGVTWKDLTVKATAADAAVKENIVSQFNVLRYARHVLRQQEPLQTILDRSHGCVKPGEMLLVLGRPGSGCSTLLKLLANRRREYSLVEGSVRYGCLPHDEAEKNYRGQIVMNTEDEIFFPNLTVNQTVDFATRLKTPFHLPYGVHPQMYRAETKEFLLASMGISHTGDTKVGNEYVRGVSGGERKRVSIVECMASQGSVYCWDNSSRGLDASSALEWAKAMRSMTDILGLSTIVTLYQAGNGIYNLFDKVLILDEGKQIYYGPMKNARPFMEDLGFLCQDGANVADYLTGITVPTERTIIPGFESTFPRNADMIRSEYEKSTIRFEMAAEYNYPETETAVQRTEAFKKSVASDKHWQLRQGSPLTTSFPNQVVACVIRQYQILLGDKSTLLIQQIVTLIQALISGSLYYNAAEDSSGLFIKSGAIFWSALYNAMVSMSEVTGSFDSRPVLVKQKGFAFFHPAAFCLAQIAADLPVILLQITTFSLVVYFMVGLTYSASSFFTYWIILFSAAMVSLESLLKPVPCSTMEDQKRLSKMSTVYKRDFPCDWRSL